MPSTFTTRYGFEQPAIGVKTGWGASRNADLQTFDDLFGASEDGIAALVTAVSGKAATVHTHAEDDVDGLVADLAAKAAAVHSHAETDVTGLVADLAAKAAAVHSHTESDVTGLVSDLAAKAATVHSHAESDVTGLVSDLAAKAPLASPTLTGTPAAPTAAVDTNTTQLATTAYVVAQASSATPQPPGTAAVGTSLRYARADHVHSGPLGFVGIFDSRNYAYFFEDFNTDRNGTLGSTGSAEFFVDHPWAGLFTSGGSITKVLPNDATTHGLIQMTTAATNAAGVVILQTSAGSGTNNLWDLSSGVWDSLIRFKLGQTTSISNVDIGFSNNNVSLIDIFASTASGTFVGKMNKEGSPTTTASLGNIDTNYHTFRIRSDGTNAYFSMDGGGELSIALTNAPTLPIGPFANLTTVTPSGAAINVKIDYLYLIKALTR